MNLTLKIIAFLLLTFSFVSCEGEEPLDTEENQVEPILLEHYYFEGKLDNEPFLMEKKVYDNGYTDDGPYALDFGGTLMNCSETPDNEVPSNCYTIYASGMVIYESTYPDAFKKRNQAKVYFGGINVDKREFDLELEAFNGFLQKEELKFRRDFGQPLQEGDFAFDFFPPDFSDTYYSSRLDDNSEFSAQITNVVESSDDSFIDIEGQVDKCKLYSSSEEGVYKLLTDLKFHVTINSAFNYNNYKDD